jgi:hypothetical protein
LFLLGDEGDALVEVTKTGAQVSVMALSGFDDTEGLTYQGSGQFVLVEERLRDVYALTYSAGSSVDRAALSSVDLGTTVGNIGLEGISFDPRDGSFVTVKEKTPQEVNRSTVTFGAPGSAATTALFTPSLGVLDLSDVQVLAAVPSLAGGADGNNLLVLSQESSRLLEVDSAGSILGAFDLLALTDSAEGVTIDADGTIFVVDESPRLYVLKPVPLPAGLWLFLGAGTALGCLGRRRARG